MSLLNSNVNSEINVKLNAPNILPQLQFNEVKDFLAYSDDDSEYSPVLQEPDRTLLVHQKLKFRFLPKEDKKLFVCLCQYILKSITHEDRTLSYDKLAFRRDTIQAWIAANKWILRQSLEVIGGLSVTSPRDLKTLNTLLSLQLVLTNVAQWRSLDNDKLLPGMTRLANNFLQHLVENGLYATLKTILVNGLARPNPLLPPISLTALFTMSTKPLLVNDFSEPFLSSFITSLLSVPGFILHVNNASSNTQQLFTQQKLCSRIVAHLNCSDVCLTIDGSDALCVIANMIQLSLLEMEVLVDHCLDFCVVLSRLLGQLSTYVGQKKSNLTTWHPVLGWFAQPIDKNLSAAMGHVTNQLKLLWNSRMVRLMFADLYDQVGLDDAQATTNAADASGLERETRPVASFTGQKSIGFRKKFDLTNLLAQLNSSASRLGKKCGVNLSGQANSSGSLGPKDLPNALKAVCMLYCFTIDTLKEIRNDILAGLSLGDLLPRMWRLLHRCGSIRDWSDVVVAAEHRMESRPNESHFLHLFAAATSNLLIILDDIELFEKNKSFSKAELCCMGEFFNSLFYQAVLLFPDPCKLPMWTSTSSKAFELFGNNSTKSLALKSKTDLTMGHKPSSSQSSLLAIALRLLSILYERDNRYNYAPHDFWLIKDIKPSAFLSDFRKERPHATFLLKYVPHIIPHKERVILFRDFVRADKASLGRRSNSNYFVDEGPLGAVIVVHRNRIVEDGYQKLANLSSNELKLKIRVQFLNAQGLDEVGIDLDGVFKEFLEETLRRVFDPSLNLFRQTSDHRLYPSPTSHMQDNHLQLFEFLGRMLAKAVYEGIVVDVPFASFFLTQLLGRERAGCYSFLDELATLDRDLYKSLTLIKHHDGDVEDLALTFSYDEDHLGQVIVHDLVPGGRYIMVTNDLKISYVHRVAHFRMYKQIRAQTVCFIRGFYSILNPSWLAMFSSQELQKLISGDSASIDIDDLRQYTKYTGGFHANHRVILWLWDVLKKDFNETQRSQFLKFVTSCSKPPLLGFQYLEPQFCIRCVQYTNEDHDLGDTLTSVMRGFLSLSSRRDEVIRLPTASTCFNLLKLPNYSSRSTLKDKLIYAINSNAGFELS